MLIVFAGRPGTGKTTLSRRVAAHEGATLLRIDAIETVVVRCGLATPPVGPVGYAVAHEVARGCLQVGVPVVVDAVNPVPEARRGWVELAAELGSPLAVVEVGLADVAEHERRVSARRPDLAGQRVPSWDEVRQEAYESWEERRDGPRLAVDGARTEEAVAQILAYVVIRRSS